MIRTLFFMILLAFLAACNRPPAPTAAVAPPAASKQAATVSLDDDARREAGLEIVEAAVRSIPVSINASGRLTTNENTTWRVGAITEGRIIHVEVKVGDHVEKGQILARLHSHDIHESRAQYRRAVGDVTRLKANLDFARRIRDRTRRLYEMKAASLEQLDQSENVVRNEQAALDNAIIEERRTRTHLTTFLQIPVAGPSDDGSVIDPETRLDDLIPVRSPATGIILKRDVTPGAVVNTSSDLFTVCDLSTIWAIAAVQEEHLSRLRPGTTARISVQAYPDRSFSGRLLKLDEQLDPATRTVSARIEIDNRAGLLKPEMYSTVELDTGLSDPAILVPQDSIQDVNGQSTVFVALEGGQFRAVSVSAGRTIKGLVQISSGLRGGEKVVARGSFILKSQMLKASLSEE